MNQSIEPKKEDWFFLYILPAFFLGVAGYSIIMLEFDSISLIMAIPFTLMAAAFHFKQKQNLRVVTLDKSGTKENFDLCIAAIKENEWEILESDDSSEILAHTKGTWRSWGELVTITFSEQTITINSRPSPYKKSSVATWGKNNINISIIKKALKCN